MKQLIYSKRQRSLFIPETWDELTSVQFIKLAGLLHEKTDEAIATDKALQILSGKNIFSYCMIPAEVRYRCYDHAEWVFLNQEITKQLIPVYKGLYGPESDFDNLILAEFHHSEIAYHNLLKNGDEDSLNEVVAILYREPKKDYDSVRNKDGDIRVPFSFSDIAYHKKIVSKWPLNVRQAIALWYDGCRQQLVSRYPPAFAGAKENTEAYFQGLYNMIRSLSGDKYGDFDKVENLYVHTAFMEIVASKQEEAELKRKYKL